MTAQIKRTFVIDAVNLILVILWQFLVKKMYVLKNAKKF